jgi:hypothetical protein
MERRNDEGATPKTEERKRQRIAKIWPIDHEEMDSYSRLMV